MIHEINYTLISIQVLLTEVGIFSVFFGGKKDRGKKYIQTRVFLYSQNCIVLKYVYRFCVSPEIALPF